MAAAIKSDEEIKNEIHMIPEFLQNKKIQAASDAKHDLETAFTDIYKPTKDGGIPDIGTPHNEFESPKGTGWDIVNAILETEIDIPKDTPPPEDQIDIEKSDIPPIITKFSKFEYKLTTMNINDDTKPSTLFDFIKDDDDQRELCLILDATTGSFQKIFAKTNDADVGGDKRHVYIIVNRETISDPAGKPNEKDPTFREEKNKKREIELHITLDTSEEKVTYPKWIEPRENYRSDFFSDFSLELTPVKYGVTKSVILTFSGTNFKNESVIETSAAGKLSNSKNAMIKLLRRIKDKLGTLYQMFDKQIKYHGKREMKEENDLRDYFVALQKKRSGDTLIALSFFDTSRTYNGNAQTFTFNDKPRFVLTHDTFNTLPISLESGADVIYTGAKTVYKFKRVKEPTDFTKAFFDTYIKMKGTRDEMTKTLKNQTIKYLEKLNTIKEEIKEVNDKLDVDANRQGTSTKQGNKQSTFTSTEIIQLKDKIAACLQKFFKLALFRSIYMMPISILKFLSEVDELSKIDEYDISIKNRVDKIKEIYYSQRPKDIEYSTGFPKFNKSYLNNLVYQEIEKFDTILSGNSYVNFGKKVNKFTYGASPVIHNYLFATDGTQRFIDILQLIYDNKYIAGGRGAEKNKAPMKEVLSAFINLTPLYNEEETSIKTEDLLDAAHGEIGVTDAGLEVQYVSSTSCVIPYHEGIRQRTVTVAESLIKSIKSIFDFDKKAGGARITEKKILELSSFILLNYMIEMNVYFEGEYNDPNIDVYGQVIPMAGKLLLHAMNFSRDPISLVLFFMRMIYYAENKNSFEKNYNGGYFVPSIFENILSNAFGPEFLEDFQEFSLTYFPKVLKHSRLRSLVPPMLEMTTPKWKIIENEMTMKIRQITRNIYELSTVTETVAVATPGKRLRNWAYNREEVAAMGGVRYKNTRKSSGRKATKSRRHKK